MAELTVKIGDQVLQSHSFDGDLLRIGRSRENDLVLDNLSVSRHHLQIRSHQGRYVLFDMNSSNGTYLNGARVTRKELLDGDQITVGKHVLVWHDESQQSTVLEDPDDPVDKESTKPRRGPRGRSQDNRPGAWLIVESGRLKGREFSIVRFETTIGKAATNDVVLTDDWLLSKRQAIILRKGNDEFEIQDLGGLRKVKINGKPIEGKHELKNGDELELGGTKILFTCTTDKGASRRARILPRRGEEPENVDVSAARLDENGFAVLPQLGDTADTDEESGRQRVPQQPVTPSPDSLDPVGDDEPVSKIGEAHGGSENGSSGEPVAIGNSQIVTARTGGPTLRSIPKVEMSANEREIKMWESALQSPSPAIRRQAVRMLKQLTGRDYGV